MDIGKRLRELREARKLSQGDIERRTGLFRSYLSRIENGYTIPTLETLARWADALDLELYQLFFESKGKPKAARVETTQDRFSASERDLIKMFRAMRGPDRRAVLSLMHQSVKAK